MKAEALTTFVGTSSRKLPEGRALATARLFQATCQVAWNSWTRKQFQNTDKFRGRGRFALAVALTVTQCSGPRAVLVAGPGHRCVNTVCSLLLCAGAQRADEHIAACVFATALSQHLVGVLLLTGRAL